MNRKWNGIERRQNLRSEAEVLVAGVSSADRATQPIEALTHELLVHKVELEMENEELRLAHAALEEARDRYVDFYDYAPVGYLTVDQDGNVMASNLTALSLLGVEHGQLINRRFSQFVSQEQQDQWHRLFRNMMEHAGVDRHGFTLAMRRGDGTPFNGYLSCLLRVTAESPPELRIALTDISTSTFPRVL